MTGYLQITPTVAYKVLSEILCSSGFPVEQPDHRKIAEIISPKKALFKHSAAVPMVSIPLENATVIVKEEYRETVVLLPPADDSPIFISHEQVPTVLEIATGSQLADATTTLTIPSSHFNEVELALLRQCGTIDEENMELSYLRTSLSLSLLEAEFLRMQLKLFNLKARSILELFQYCEGSNAGFCRCPEIRKRVYEMGILVQRAEQ